MLENVSALLRGEITGTFRFLVLRVALREFYRHTMTTPIYSNGLSILSLTFSLPGTLISPFRFPKAS